MPNTMSYQGFMKYPDSYRGNGLVQPANILESSGGGFDFGGAAPYALGAGALGSVLFSKKKRSGQAAQGALSAGMTALSLTGNPLIAGGAALVGGLYGAFTKSPEEERNDRFKAAIEKSNEAKNKALAEHDNNTKQGVSNIGKMTGGLTKRFRDSAGSRAAAIGRTSDVESFELPVAGKVAEAGSQSLSDFMLASNQQKEAITKQYDDQILQLQQAQLMGEDIDPNAIDYMSQLAPVAVDFAYNQQEMDLLKKYLNVN